MNLRISFSVRTHYKLILEYQRNVCCNDNSGWWKNTIISGLNTGISHRLINSTWHSQNCSSPRLVVEKSQGLRQKIQPRRMGWTKMEVTRYGFFSRSCGITSIFLHTGTEARLRWETYPTSEIVYFAMHHQKLDYSVALALHFCIQYFEMISFHPI